MTKKGPLSKAESFYIEKNFHTINVETLAKELDRSHISIEKHIEKCRKIEKKNTTILADEQFIHHKGATIMTENASILSDALKKSRPIKPISDCVTKIK